MKYEVVQSADYPGHWYVEPVDPSNGNMAAFSGPNAEELAREYARWKNFPG